MPETISEAQQQVALDPAWQWDRQHVYDFPHAWQYIRDVPRSCACSWVWGWPTLRWVRYSTVLGCAWHDMREGQP